MNSSYNYPYGLKNICSNTQGTTYPTKFYYWDQGGRIIGEGVSGQTDFSVRYIYNGNEKVAMERQDMRTGTAEIFYFVNNAQGTPTLIVDANDQSVSRLNLDEFGNPGIIQGPATEVNYTGKKLDQKTNLYYFNQRYYDPELGRFLQEDPQSQTLNPYLYCGNNPLIYTDPDGQFFQFLIPMFIAALQAGATSAAINAAAQYVMTGSINTQSVWNSFGSGALSGGLANGIGGMMGHLTEGLGKTLAHGVSGGLQSMANGGNFGSGFVGGAVGNMAGEASTGAGMLESAGIAGLASGATSWASGGDFATGFQAGANNVLYNKLDLAGGVKKWVQGFGINLGQKLDGIPDVALDMGGFATSLASYGAAALELGAATTNPIGWVAGGITTISLAKTYFNVQKNGPTMDNVLNGGLSLVGIGAKPGLLSYALSKSSLLYNTVRGNYKK